MGRRNITGESVKTREYAEFYVVAADPQVQIQDGEIVVIVEAYYGDREEPLELRLNLGDDIDGIRQFLNEIYIKAELLHTG